MRNLTPQTLLISHYYGSFPALEGDTVEKIHRLFNVPGLNNTCVLWNGHEFRIGDLRIDYGKPFSGEWHVSARTPDDDVPERPVEYRMYAYFPIDPRTNEKDWHGATSAYANATNDGWLPAHCDNDHMLDREVELRAALVAVLQPEIDNLLQAVLTATDNKPSDWPIGTPWETRQTRRLKYQTMLKFREDATKCLLTEARSRYIGWYHQNPHESHLHNLVHDCITTTLRAENSPYTTIYTEVRNAAVSLAPHTYETRWDKKARLKAEAEAEAAAESESESASDSESEGAGD